MKAIITPKDGWNEMKSTNQTDFETLPFSVELVIESPLDDAVLKEIYERLPDEGSEPIVLNGSDFIVKLIHEYILRAMG